MIVDLQALHVAPQTPTLEAMRIIGNGGEARGSANRKTIDDANDIVINMYAPLEASPAPVHYGVA